jgi:hypothetical protein
MNEINFVFFFVSKEQSVAYYNVDVLIICRGSR